MKELPKHKDCCGCEACAQVCPKRCIVMQEDDEGFLYPVTNKNICIDCHLCEQVCPILNQIEGRHPLQIYTTFNPDMTVRMNSSSGGIFSMFAEQVIKEGGVVFGALFDEHWNVVHGYVDTLEGITLLRGSKYVQSRIGNAYQEAKLLLKEGRKVLFSGTPCQIAGLKTYLRHKEYENLLTIDVVCHGVPSPGVWRKYLQEEVAQQRDGKNTVLPRPIHEKDVLVEGISFRDKGLGWKKYSFALALSTTNGSGEKFSFCSCMPLNENPFLKGFIADLYLRPSCYHCVYKNFSSQSDVTLADAWGVWDYYPKMYDDKGTSLLILSTSKAEEWFHKLDVQEKVAGNISILKKYNPATFVSPRKSRKRKRFFRLIRKYDVARSVSLCLPPPTYWDKILWSINKRIKKYFK